MRKTVSASTLVLLCLCVAARAPGKPAAAGAPKPASEPEEEETADDPKPEDDKPPQATKKPLDPELYRLLADPLRATRRRYLIPGNYTVEIRSGALTRKTPLKVQREKSGFGPDGGNAELE